MRKTGEEASSRGKSSDRTLQYHLLTARGGPERAIKTPKKKKPEVAWKHGGTVCWLVLTVPAGQLVIVWKCSALRSDLCCFIIMLSNGRNPRVFLKTFNHFQHFNYRTESLRGTVKLHKCWFCCTAESPPRIRSRPPWRLMFFGTDQFAVESLRFLTDNRYWFHPRCYHYVDRFDLGCHQYSI